MIPENLILNEVEERVVKYCLTNTQHEFRNAEVFLNSSNKQIFQATIDLRHHDISLEMLKTRVEPKYHGHLESLWNEGKVSKDVTSDFSLLKENCFLASVFQVNDKLNRNLAHATHAEALEKIAEWRLKLNSLERHTLAIDNTALVNFKDISDGVLLSLIERGQNGNRIVGYPSGINSLDDYTLGFMRQEFTIIGGRPAMGKTAILVTLLRNHIYRKEAKPVIFFSLEMSKEQIHQRLLSSISRVKFQKIRNGIMSKDEWLRIIYAKNLIDASNVFIDDTAAAHIDYMMDKTIGFGSDKSCVMIDYLQLAKGTGSEKRLQVTDIANKCKEMSKLNNCPVLGLAQINRGSENPANSIKRPTASDLAESDGLTQAADGIILLHRDKKYNPDSLWGNTAELILAKQRNGPVGTTFALFAEEYVSFESVTVR